MQQTINIDIICVLLLVKQSYFFCDCVWMRGHIDVMRMSHWVTNAVWYTRGHMNLSVIIGQFVNSNGTHSSNITFCLSQKPAIFNDMSPTQRNFHNFTFLFKTDMIRLRGKLPNWDIKDYSKVWLLVFSLLKCVLVFSLLERIPLVFFQI